MFLETEVGKKYLQEKSDLFLLVKDCSHGILLACFLLQKEKTPFILKELYTIGNILRPSQGLS